MNVIALLLLLVMQETGNAEAAVDEQTELLTAAEATGARNRGAVTAANELAEKMDGATT
jgi:hypothetical protein